MKVTTAGRAEVFFSTNVTWQFAPGTNEASSPVGLWRTNIYNAGGFSPYYQRLTFDIVPVELQSLSVE